MAVGLLHGLDRQAGGDHAVEGDVDERAAGMMGGMEEAAGLAGEAVQGTFFRERIDMTLDGKWTRETEMRLDLADGRRDSLLTLMRVDEIEDLLLACGEDFGHVFN